MSERLHVCRICGKKFATPKGVWGHQRIHSRSQRIWGFKESRVCSVSSSMMTEIEKHEVIEAAMNLVMLSQGVYDFAGIRNLLLGDDDFMDLEVSQSGFEKLSTCSDDVVAQALASYQRSKLKKRSQSKNSKNKCKICGKSFVCSKALGGHQTLHRSTQGKFARKMEYIEDGNSLFDSSEAKKIVSISSRLGLSQEEKMLHSVDSKPDFSELLSPPEAEKIVSEPQEGKILHSVQQKLDFSELISHSGFDRSSSCSKTRFNALPSPPEAERNVSQPSSFEVSEEEEKMIQCVEPKLDLSVLLSHYSAFDKSSSCSKTRFNALPSPPEAERNVSQPSSFEVSEEEEKMIQCVEPKLDLSVLLSHYSAFDKSSSCSKTRFNALPSPPEAERNVSQPSSFEVSEEEEKMIQCVEPKLDLSVLLSHYSAFDKSSSCSKTRFNALPSPPEAKKNVSQPSSFEVSEEEEKMLHCVEPKLDFTTHSGFNKSSSKSQCTYRFKICGRSFSVFSSSK